MIKSQLLDAIIKAIKDNIPASQELLAWEVSEQPVLFRSGTFGFFQEINFKLKIGYMPDIEGGEK